MPWNTNPYIGGPYNTAGTGYIQGRALSEIPSPATTFMVVERPFTKNALGVTSGAACNCPDNQTGTTPTYLSRPIHFDGYNYLFADGHVKFLRPEGTVGTGTLSTPLGLWTIAEND
jgi:prepilin-type processing-associated H-X9-DG protein